MLSRILDRATLELSECLDLIWSEKSVKANLEKLKRNPTLGEIKRKIDSAQETLLELQIYLETFEKRVATGFYWLEDVAI